MVIVISLRLGGTHRFTKPFLPVVVRAVIAAAGAGATAIVIVIAAGGTLVPHHTP